MWHVYSPLPTSAALLLPASFSLIEARVPPPNARDAPHDAISLFRTLLKVQSDS